MSTPLTDLQDWCAGRANEDSFFQYTTITALRELTIAGQIADALACRTVKGGKSGTALLVMMAGLQCNKPAMDGPNTDGYITFRALEDPKLKTSGSPTAEEIALHVLSLFHGWAPGMLNGSLYASEAAVKPSLEFAPKLAYDITFNFKLVFAQTARVAIPQISYAGGLVTLLSATGGANVYYTVNGTFPSSSTNLYAAPFAAAVGTRVCAMAYKAGMDSSHGKELLLA
jgi:hypothetical protein